MLTLVGTDGERYYTFDLTPGKHILGRKPECDITIPNKTVSRRHAEIEVGQNGESVFVTDLGSHNGTMHNNMRVTNRTEVKTGDQLTFGSTEFRITPAGEISSTPTRSKTYLSDADPEKSVFISMNEALKPLPSRATERPELFPTLSEMAKMLVLSDPKEVMLEKALGLVSRVVPADRLAVLFTSEDSDEIYTAATLLPTGKDPGKFTLSRTIIDRLLDEKDAILIGDVAEDPRLKAQQSIIMSELRSAMAVPMFDEGKVLGILYVDSTNPMHRYTDEYLRILAMFGNIIASRLLNYELIEEREERQVIDAEMRRAAGIQAALLNTDPPTIQGFAVNASLESSRSVGGDLYDVVQLPGGHLLFLVADVSGKGMGAALLMSNILASFRIMYEQEPFTLLETVEKVSAQLFNYSAPGDFATLFAGVIAPEGDTLTYVNAGHNPPMLVRCDGSVETLPASGTMIGAFDMNTWSESSVQLKGGEVLFVFSDGVTEAEDPDGNQYGEERAQKTLVEASAGTPEEITRALRSDIAEFVKGAPQSDDVTILIVKKEGTC